MDFTLSPEVDALRLRIRDFTETRIIPLEADPDSWDAHENIRLDLLEDVRAEVKAQGLWAPQMPRERGGLGLGVAGMAACYEEMGRSLFGPVSFNCAAPDDGNMILLERVGTETQKERWLDPIIAGRVRSAFAMTEPAPGSGSDPSMMLTTAERDGDDWRINGRKWFITGGAEAQHFILVARTSDDERRGLTAFLFDADQPGWEIERRIPIMGPEEHGGHCELRFDGLEIPDENRLMGVGEGHEARCRSAPRHGAADPLHALARHGAAGARGIAADYVRARESFGHGARTSTRACSGCWARSAMEIEVGRLLTMRAACPARRRASFAQPGGGDGQGRTSPTTLHKAVDTAIQLCGARGYSKDTPLEWMYRYARQARLVDGASEVHKMVLARLYMQEEHDFWSWQ